jgi:hypothetical protein
MYILRIHSSFCFAFHEEHLPVARQVTEEGICFSTCSLKLTTVFRRYLSLAIVLAREGVEVHLHAAQTKTEHFCLFV